MTYIWEGPEWPDFSVDATPLLPILSAYDKKAGRLVGSVEQLQHDNQLEAYLDLMVDEAISSSAIENEKLNRKDVRSSLKNYLGLSVPPVRVTDARAEGIAVLMVDVRNTFSAPLTAEMLYHWHQLVLHDGDLGFGRQLTVGAWRDAPMGVVSGPMGHEIVHYTAPPAEDVPGEMQRFLEWFNDTDPQVNPQAPHGLIRAALAHLWFEAIHPFDDGNGRVGRAIAEKALAQDLQAPPLLSLSSEIDKRRDGYYQELGAATRGTSMDVTQWAKWFAECALAAQIEAVHKVTFTLDKARFWDKHGSAGLNDRQLKAVRRMFDAGYEGFQGGMTARKYAHLTGCSKATATRDLAALVDLGCLISIDSHSKKARYELSIPNRTPALVQQAEINLERLEVDAALSKAAPPTPGRNTPTR